MSNQHKTPIEQAAGEYLAIGLLLEKYGYPETTKVFEAIEQLLDDKKRLDFLDWRNDRKNEKNQTTYGWGLTENCNRIALEDHHFPVLKVRQAVDAAMADPFSGAEVWQLSRVSK